MFQEMEEGKEERKEVQRWRGNGKENKVLGRMAKQNERRGGFGAERKEINKNLEYWERRLDLVCRKKTKQTRFGDDRIQIYKKYTFKLGVAHQKPGYSCDFMSLPKIIKKSTYSVLSKPVVPNRWTADRG